MMFQRIALDEAAKRLADMQGVSKWDTSNGLASIENVIGNGAAFIASIDNQPAMLFAIDKFDLEGGKLLQIRVARQLLQGADLTAILLPQIEYTFGYDCQAAQLETKRRGLMAKVEKLGYSEASRKYWKTWFCFAWLPLYFGGDSSSTTQQTTNNYDQRKVITNTLDGGAITGALNLATKVADNITSITGQVVKSSADSQIHAYDYAGGIFDSAVDFANKNDSRALNAYDRAATITADALSTIKASSLATTSALQGAYADAKGTSDSQKQIMLAALAGAVVIVIAVMNKG